MCFDCYKQVIAPPQFNTTARRPCIDHCQNLLTLDHILQIDGIHTANNAIVHQLMKTGAKQEEAFISRSTQQSDDETGRSYH